MLLVIKQKKKSLIPHTEAEVKYTLNKKSTHIDAAKQTFFQFNNSTVMNVILITSEISSPLLVLASVTRSGSLLLAVGRNMRFYFSVREALRERPRKQRLPLRILQIQSVC